MSLHTLMFGWEYPPAHCGGLGVACQGIVRGLLHHGAQVTLVLPHDQAEQGGATVISPTSKQWSEAMITIPSLLQAYDSPEVYQERIEKLRMLSVSGNGVQALYGQNLGEEVERFTSLAVEMTKDTNPDIIHTHDWMTIDAGRRAARHHQRPLIAHVHATELDRTEFHPNEWIYLREREGLKAANHVIAVSEYTRNLLVREYGIPADKISVLHNGVHEAPPAIHRTERNKRHPLVLFLGRLTVQKGALHFLKAARQIADINPDARFVVAGHGYLLPELIQNAYDMGLADKVVFAGHVKSEEANKLYRQTDCFVMPSVSEPFGLVALEAITHGAPVVLSKQSGAAEVVHNALTVDFWDTDRMADCILTILREKPMRAQMRSETPRILKNLTWEKQGGKIISIYNNVIQ